MHWFLSKIIQYKCRLCITGHITQAQQIRLLHYNDVLMRAMASQIISLAIVYSSAYSGADQRRHQSSASLAFVRGIHRRPVNAPHKGPVTRKMFPFDDVIMKCQSRIHIQDQNLVITMPADILAPNGARPAAGTVMNEKLNMHVFLQVYLAFNDHLAYLWTGDVIRNGGTYADLGARKKNQPHGSTSPSHIILWDVIICPWKAS